MKRKAAAHETPDARSPIKDPEDWKTGAEPMTAAQESDLNTLATEAGEEPEAADLTKAEASERIDELQEKTGPGPDRRSGG